jgi:Gtr1/RagA G protein conserved region.
MLSFYLWAEVVLERLPCIQSSLLTIQVLLLDKKTYYLAKETMNIGFTVDVAESKIKFMGNLSLNLWDCGG